MRLTRGTTRLLAVTGALALTTAGLAACSNARSSEDSAGCESSSTIAFSHPSSEAVVVKAIKRYIQKAADEDGCVTVLFDSTQANNLESQRTTIESWIAQEVDAITVFPIDLASMEPLMHQAQSQGIKWLTYASFMDGQDGSVGFDNDKMGQLIADDVVSWISRNHPDNKISAAVTTLTPLPSVKGALHRPGCSRGLKPPVSSRLLAM